MGKECPRFGAQVHEYDSDKHVVTVVVTRVDEDPVDEEDWGDGAAANDGVAGVEIVDWRDRVVAWTRTHGPFTYCNWRDRVQNWAQAGQYTIAKVELDLRKPQDMS